MHLLKYPYQPEKRSPSWRSSIIEHRFRIQETFEDSPSLKPYLLENCSKTYQKARKQAAVETELPQQTFPQDWPFSPAAVLDYEWIPE